MDINTVTIGKKEYVLVAKKQYNELLLKAAAKVAPSKKLTLSQGKKLAYKLIDQWAKER